MGRYVCGERWAGCQYCRAVVTTVILKTGVWQIQIQRKSPYAVIPAQAGIQKFEMAVNLKYF